MSATLSDRPNRVPSEYAGLARLFHREVQIDDREAEKAHRVITKPLRYRVQRHPRLRPEQVAGAIRQYRQLVPSRFRIGELAINPDRASFSIADRRLLVTWLNAETWNAPGVRELGVGIGVYRMELHDGKLSQCWQVEAIVSMHSLGRWMERTGLRDHGALLADLAALIGADETTERIPTPSGYFWLGAVLPMKGPRGETKVRSVRTLVID